MGISRAGDGGGTLDDGSSSLPEPEYVEFPLHSSTVTGMVVSTDGRCLFSSSDDGTVFAMGIPYPLPSRAAKSLTAAPAAVGAGAAVRRDSWLSFTTVVESRGPS